MSYQYYIFPSSRKVEWKPQQAFKRQMPKVSRPRCATIFMKEHPHFFCYIYSHHDWAEANKETKGDFLSTKDRHLRMWIFDWSLQQLGGHGKDCWPLKWDVAGGCSPSPGKLMSETRQSGKKMGMTGSIGHGSCFSWELYQDKMQGLLTFSRTQSCHCDVGLQDRELFLAI